MNKAELIDKLASDVDITKEKAGAAISSLTGIITEALRKGEKVQLVGFGTFETRTRAGRKGVNPKTGEAMNIPEMTVPAFRAGAGLKDAVRA